MKMNYSKSEAMGVALPSPLRLTLHLNFNFKWTSSALKYMGTRIPPNIVDTFKMNLPPLLRKVRSLLDKCNRGLHSWFGYCNSIKMSILPRFLYLFQTLPISIPLAFFCQINTLFTKFIWAHKLPRISRRLLSLNPWRGSCPRHTQILAMDKQISK